MTKKLEIVGREASLLQLADASIQVCFGLYGIFSMLQRTHNVLKRHLVGMSHPLLITLLWNKVLIIMLTHW